MPSVKAQPPGLCCFRPKRNQQDEPKPLNQRGCTDCLCLLLFVAFLVALGAVFFYAAASGDWNEYLYAADYLGNRCGQGAYANASKAFYPRIALDLQQQSDKIYTAPWSISLYAICVAACPEQFDISSPVLIRDYGYDPRSSTTAALGSGTQAEWVSALPTADLVNRCIPKTETGQFSRELCAYPNCTSAEVGGLGVACDGEYPAEWNICPSGSTSAECSAQRQTCQVKATHLSGVAYSEYTSEDNANSMVILAETVDGFYSVASTLADAYGYIIVGGIVLPVMAAFLFMLCLRFFARLIVYLLLLLLVVFMLAITVLCYIKSGMDIGGVTASSLLDKASQNITLTNPTLESLTSVEEGNQWIWTLAFVVMLLLTFLTLLAVITARKKIKICIAIVAESTKVFVSMPSLMISPTWAVLAQALVSVWAIAGVALLLTTKPETYVGALDAIPEAGSGHYVIADGLERMRQLQKDEVTTGLAAFHLFGYLWLTQFVGAVAWTAMSGAVCHWYFFRNDPREATRVPILRSLYRVLRYHIGSMAFGSLIIAFIQFCQCVLAYVERHTSRGNSFALKLAFKCCQLCLYCLEKTIKFITYYGFVFVALRGDNFCSACYMTFKFIVSNPVQVSMNSLVTRLLTLSTIFTIPVGCAIGTYVYIDRQTSIVDAIYPAAAAFLLGAFVTQACMGVFECVVTTVFVCCFRDASLYNGKYMSAAMRKAFGIDATPDAGGEPQEGGDAPQEGYTQKV